MLKSFGEGLTEIADWSKNQGGCTGGDGCLNGLFSQPNAGESLGSLKFGEFVSMLGTYGKQHMGGGHSTAFRQARDEIAKEGKTGSVELSGRYARIVITPREGETPEEIEEKAKRDWERTTNSFGKGPMREDWNRELGDPNSPVYQAFDRVREACRQRRTEKGEDPSFCNNLWKPKANAAP